MIAVEVVGSKTNWAEPKDLDIRDVHRWRTDPTILGPSSIHNGVINFLALDGSVRALPASMSDEELRRLFLVDPDLPPSSSGHEHSVSSDQTPQPR